MRTHRIAVAVLLLACGTENAPAPTPRTTERTVEQPPAMLLSPPREPPPDARAALREARALARRGEYPQAFARMEPLLNGIPTTASFRCEAGYIAFRANQLDRAVPLIRGAAADYPPPTDEASRNAFARCLYNVGLVADAAHDDAAAVQAYQQSFTLRANRTVYEHLTAASLRADAGADREREERVGAIARRAIGPSPSFEDLTRALVEYCMVESSSAPRDARYCPSEIIRRVRSSGGPILEAAVISAASPHALYLAIREAGGARLVGSIGSDTYEDGEGERIDAMSFQELVPPAGGDLVLDVTSVESEVDYDYGEADCEEYDTCRDMISRSITRRRIVCAPAGASVGCVGLPTLELEHRSVGYQLPCDRDPPSEPYGRGWSASVRFDAQGRASTTPRALRVEGRRCPDADEDPERNEAEGPTLPRALRNVPFATLAGDRAFALGTNFPVAPFPYTPPALAFRRPWIPPFVGDRGSELEGDLSEITAHVADECAALTDSQAPDCCPFDGRCNASIRARASSGTDEVVILDGVCLDPFTMGEDVLWRVLARGTRNGAYRVIATIDERRGEQVRLPPVRSLRLSDAISSASGLEVRFSFTATSEEPAFDARTSTQARQRSVTDVEVLCTAGDDARCYAFPIVYRGSNLAEGGGGQSALIGSMSYELTMAIQGDRLSFTAVQAPVAAVSAHRLVGSHTLSELDRFNLPRWDAVDEEE